MSRWLCATLFGALSYVAKHSMPPIDTSAGQDKCAHTSAADPGETMRPAERREAAAAMFCKADNPERLAPSRLCCYRRSQ